MAQKPKLVFEVPPGVRVREGENVSQRFRTVKCPFPRHSYFEGAHGTVHFSDQGQPDASPILLLHGFNASRTMFTPIADFLVSKGYFRAIALDLYGCGLSNNPEVKGSCCSGKKSVTYNLALFISQIHELLAHLELEAVDIFGFSMGGAIAVAFARQYPKMVKKLVLMSPAGFLPRKGSLFKQHQVFLRYTGCVSIPVIDAFIGGNKWYFSHERRVGSQTDKKKGERWTEPMYQKVIWTMFIKKGTLKSMLDTARNMPWFGGMREVYEEVAQHPRPVLLLWGTEDQVFPPAVRDQVVGIFKGNNSCLRYIRGAGHIALCEQVQRTVQELAPFLHLPDTFKFPDTAISGTGETLASMLLEETGQSINDLYPAPSGRRTNPLGRAPPTVPKPASSFASDASSAPSAQRYMVSEFATVLTPGAQDNKAQSSKDDSQTEFV